MTIGKTSQQSYQIAGTVGTSPGLVSQLSFQEAYGPPSAELADATQRFVQVARTAGTTNVTAKVTQEAIQVAYLAGEPSSSRLDSWTFSLDGHRFYVLPLGLEGDWVYDTSTQEWCQFQTQGFSGINFGHGVMWDMRIMGGDKINTNLLELDPNQPLDDAFRPVEHVVTGGIASRGRHAIGVANFTLTASVGDDQSTLIPISLAFSDDNGVSWSREFDIPLSDAGSQLLIWNALGSFTAPGRVFRVTDFAGPVRIDGADVVLTVGTGADSGVSDPE